MDDIKQSQAYRYCEWCLEGGNDKVGIYVKKQAKAWKDIVDGIDNEACIDMRMYDQICAITKLMVHPDLGCSIYEGMERYQWFFIVATLCTVKRDNGRKYYVTSLLEISRKNYKTFSSAIVFIIGSLLEPQFSRFFSVAPDYKLSSELKKAIEKIIKSSPYLINRFKIKRDMIFCKLTEIEYTPLAYSNDRMDGKICRIR